MKKTIALLAFTVIITAASAALAADDEKDFQPLFNGKDLSGWKLRDRRKPSWSVEPGGILKNTAVEEEHNGSDLLTTNKFWNFTVRYEYMTPQNSNSGFFLRGRHEIQILGDYRPNRKPDDTCNGSIYGFKAPDKFVTKPGGEWQTVEATIIGDRITVILNGVKIHDNVQCDRATGSEIDGRVKEPGPIMLQGDHGTVSFRNIRIKELPKE
jgi:3-keto-disaccharide hydrolase